MTQRIAVAVLALSMWGGFAARADITVTVENGGANSPSTGNTVEVDITNTGPGTIVIAGFSLEVTTADPYISFSGATMATASPYIFAGNSGDAAYSFPLAISAVGQIIDVGDFYLTPSSGTSLSSGVTAGLALLTFDVGAGDPAASAIFALTAYPSTSLSDPAGNDLPIDTLTSGAVTLTTTGTLPEYGYFPLLLAIAALLIFARIRRVRKLEGDRLGWPVYH